MKTKVNGGKASIVMLVFTTAILLAALPLTSYLPSRYSADATNGGRGDDSQTSKDLGKEEQDESPRGDDSQTSKDLGKEEQDESPRGEESEEIIEENSDVDQELLDELRGGDDIKGSGIAEGEESEGDPLSELRGGETTKQAPIAISGENVYTVWWTNDTANGNDEVMFRASIDGGSVFGNKTNLSNTTDADSVDAEIAAEGGNVMVTWWERNSTSNEPVAKISTDNGQTFGPHLRLANNGSISGDGAGGSGGSGGG